MPGYYRLNEPDISAEAFDEEIMAINLSSGHYHSVREAGFHVWNLLMRGCSVEETAGALSKAYPFEGEVAAADTRTFVGELEAAGLIVPTAEPTGARTAPIEAPKVGGQYRRPVLESYTDMQELLLIDPIHEVDVLTGWPHGSDGSEKA